jgi:signal recognition particle subunit SEC65
MALSHNIRPMNLCIANLAKESIIDRAEDRRLLPVDHTSTYPPTPWQNRAKNTSARGPKAKGRATTHRSNNAAASLKAQVWFW